MPKIKLCNGDRVEFAQKLIPTLSTQNHLVGERGELLYQFRDKAMVKFDNHGQHFVKQSDLEVVPDIFEPLPQDSTSQPSDMDQLMHAQRSTLIHEKLDTQENNPEQDRDINTALSALAVSSDPEATSDN
jgi:hypothetical protein